MPTISHANWSRSASPSNGSGITPNVTPRARDQCGPTMHGSSRKRAARSKPNDHLDARVMARVGQRRESSSGSVALDFTDRHERTERVQEIFSDVGSRDTGAEPFHG